ncbi:hypothetical protein [Jeotgalibacillus salarius]|uniref:Uncharacterized protein n=1 Tax=Jeotgalibacillus salarius TaxID=546023 RepID=A0A4Y8LHZ6_9BACL|nr:hypothetical protein [Jeotgalibacillus salarius]TFE02364.1 hypothetical protein E2626_07230 [Jeotgalibacillus salarius]
MKKVDLIAVVHDPRGNLLFRLKKSEETMMGLYNKVWITVSNESSEQLLQYLCHESPFHVKVIPKGGAAHARRAVVAFGLDSSCSHYHYCDLDRLLTWISYHPEELSLLVRDIPQYDYLVIGRTDQAMYTHPESWVETEKITNKICSLTLGWEIDITAGSCAFSNEIGEVINQYSEAKMTDAEWLMIAKKRACVEVSTIQVNGLEYHESINAPTTSVEEAEQWFSRLRLSMVISETLLK